MCGTAGGMPAAVAAKALSEGRPDLAGPAVLQPFRGTMLKTYGSRFTLILAY